MRPQQSAVPAVVTIYGALGVMPFVAPPLVALLFPAMTGPAATLQALYAALILSFLGGARWGLEVRRHEPRLVVISLAMLPTLGALALLLVPGEWRSAQLAALALLLVVHLAWDARSAGLPVWYARLRAPLTIGAVGGLVAGVAISAG